MKHERNNLACDPWDSEGNEKTAVSISIAFSLEFFIRNEISFPRNAKQKTA